MPSGVHVLLRDPGAFTPRGPIEWAGEGGVSDQSCRSFSRFQAQRALGRQQPISQRRCGLVGIEPPCAAKVRKNRIKGGAIQHIGQLVEICPEGAA